MSQCKHEQVVGGEIYYCQLGEGHARMHYHESDNPAFKIGYRAGQLAMRERARNASCVRCAGGWPLTKTDAGEDWHVAPEAGHILLPNGRCGAVYIRALEPEELK